MAATHRPTVRSFESQLREIRQHTGITFQEIADRMGVSGAYISQIMKRDATIEQIERVARALKIPPETFDVYHVLAFRENVKEGDPTALQLARLMIELWRLPENSRNRLLTSTLQQARRAALGASSA